MRCGVFVALALMQSSTLLRADMIATVTVSPGPSTWSYTLFNNDPLSSPDFISSFSLSVNAPITVTGTPTGWDFSTDHATFIFWFNADPEFPYPNDVAPGSSLAGFALISSATSSQLLTYGLAGWDHSLDEPGPTVAGTVLAPSLISAVPEPKSLFLLIGGAFLLVAYHRRTHSRL